MESRRSMASTRSMRSASFTVQAQVSEAGPIRAMTPGSTALAGLRTRCFGSASPSGLTLMLQNIQHIHFIGIGGAGLSAIAKVLIEQGKTVSGSDQTLNPATEALAGLGATVYGGHSAQNLSGAELVVVSSAIRADNPELAAARASLVPVIKRDVLLGELMQSYIGIAIAGTAGKTTTAGMLAYCLSELGLDPTFVVGGVMENYETNARAGHGPHLVVEADEYDRMFLGLNPAHAIVTNVEFDHPDCFSDEADVVRAFQSFLALPGLHRRDSVVLLCGDPANARLLRRASANALSYGFADQNDYRIIDPQTAPGRGSDFVVARDRRSLAVVHLELPGRHNMLNACAVVALCDQLHLDVSGVAKALSTFRGTHRRFEIVGEVHGVTIVDDYAHHPTKIRATLEAARERFEGRKLWAVFQPHTYSRTRALLDDFAAALDAADEVIVTEVFPARETDTLGVSGEQIVERMHQPRKHFLATLGEAASFLQAQLVPGDVVMLLGAGDINRLAERLLHPVPTG
jgi:UDP-N-acetylmuramate--alanine ligase